MPDPEPKKENHLTYVQAWKSAGTPRGPFFEDLHWEWRQRQLDNNEENRNNSQGR